MRALLTVILAALTASASAPAQVGVGSVVGSNNLKVTSFDQQWTVGAITESQYMSYDQQNHPVSHYGIFDQEGHTLFEFPSETMYHESVTISFSPDSRRVVIMDQQPKAPIFIMGELANGQWHEVPLSLEGDPKMPKLTDVTKATLGEWVNPTTIKVTLTQLYHEPPDPRAKRMKYTTTLNFSTDKVNFAAK